MEVIPTTLLTASEFFDWTHRPENRDRHFELERGRVVEVSRPGEMHGVVCSNVAWILGSYIRQWHKGYACSNDTGIIWENDPDTVKGPDIVFYDVDRPFAELHPKYSEEVPTLAVEVLSPNDRANKVNRRIHQFLKWGVALVWLVDPDERTVIVWRKDRAPELLEVGQEITGDGVLADFRCPVTDFFSMPGQASAPALS